MIAQCAVTAGLAWWLGQLLLRHPMPFFAPIAAIICLGVTFGNRMRRGVEVAIGVATGVGIGDLFVHLVGSGVWQIVLVVAVAMSVASLVGAGQLIIVQAGVQCIVVVTLLPNPDQGLGRWLDALLGCVVALLVATIAPSAPLRRPGQLAAQVLRDMAGTLDAAVAALRAGDEAAADAVLARARSGEQALESLENAAGEGLAVVRQSPFRRRQVAGVQAYADLTAPLSRAHRNLRVLARRCVVALWRAEEVPAGYQEVLAELAEVARFMAGELADGRLPAAARKRLVAVAEASSHLPSDASMSAVVVLAQARSMMIDLMELTGLDLADARAAMPNMD